MRVGNQCFTLQHESTDDHPLSLLILQHHINHLTVTEMQGTVASGIKLQTFQIRGRHAAAGLMSTVIRPEDTDNMS